MKNSLISLTVLILIVGSFFIGRYYKSSATADVKDTIAPKVKQIVIKNDSLLRINDSIDLKVITIEKTYEKTIDDIVRNNPSNDYSFFSTYIERYRGQYNSDTAQNSKLNIR